MTHSRTKIKFVIPLARTLGTLLLCASLLVGGILYHSSFNSPHGFAEAMMSWLPAPSTVFAAPVAPHPNTEIVLGISYDGTAPFVPDAAFAANTDGQHTPGADEHGNNFVVRTFDIVQYRMDWNVNEVDGTNVVITSILPAANELEWVIDPDLPLPPGCKDSGVTPISSISADGKTLICNLGDQPEGTSGTIFPNALVGKHLDNQTFTINSTIKTDQSPVVTSNDIELTISAAPKWDWLKDESPDVYIDVDYNGDPGQVVVWPIYLTGGVGDLRGIEEMNDAVAIQFFDHLYAWTADIAPPFNATLITAANVGNLNNYNGRVCGGYSGDGSFPYGVNIPGTTNATNTTQGVQDGTETITCAELPAASATAGYPIVQIDIAGHNTKSVADKHANGKANSSVAIAAQIVFFVSDSEFFPLNSGNGYIHNAISGDTNAIAPPSSGTPETVTTVPVGSSIQVAGTSGLVNETTTDDNLIEHQLEYGVLGGGVGGLQLRSWVEFSPALQLREIKDTGTGLSSIGFDHRGYTVGGLSYHGLGPDQGEASGAYDFKGEVARGQDFTLGYALSPSDNRKPWATTNKEELHGCIYFDNTWIEMTEMPTSIDVMQTLIESPGTSATGGYTTSPSHRQAHVLYGDQAHLRSKARDLVRINPAFQPNYVLEFAQAATSVGISYDRHEVTCRQVDAADLTGDSVGDWIDANDPNFDTIFGRTADGRYPTIEMVRLRTLDPVPWQPPFPDETIRNGILWNVGASFNIFLNVRVKTTIPNPIDGTHKIYAHSSDATGPWDGIGDPPTPHCYNAYYNLPSGFPNTQVNPPNGFCNMATTPPIPGAGDPLTQWNTPHMAHRDTVTVVSSRPVIKKRNLAGLQDMVDNGDLVTYRIDVGVVGADIIPDTVADIVMTDTIPAYYEFVGFQGTQSTQFNNETSSTPGTAVATPHCAYDGISKQVLCNFGDQVGGWSDVITITLKVVNANANQALPNKAEIGSSTRDTKSSIAYAYMVPARHELELRKEVLDLDGDCTRSPGVAAHVVGDCSVTEMDGVMTFTLNYTNTGNVTMNNIHFIDAIPHVGDNVEPQTNFASSTGAPISGITGDGRTPPSAFSGSISLVSATDSNGSVIQHTVDPVATVDRNPATNTNAWLAGTAAGATGIKMEIPQLTPGMTGTVTLVYSTLGNVNDDIYTNNFGSQAFGNPPAAGSSSLWNAGAIYVGNRSNDVSVMVLEVMVGSTVWNDVNNNGIQDPGEAGFNGVTVELYDPGPDGAIGGIDDVLVVTTTTDINGDYLFDELHPDNYYIMIPAPPITATTSSGPTSFLDDGVDGNDNGDQPGGAGGVTYSPIISLTVGTEPTETFQGSTPDDQDDDSGDLTIDFGFFEAVEIGNYVWIEDDNDGDSTTGVVTPVVGTVVTAIDGAGNVYTATTDAAGQYTITVAANNTYTVTAGTPPGHAPSGSLVGSSSSPTDPDGMSHDPAGTVVTVDTQNNYTIDFGFVPNLSIGSTLFYDNDNDGQQGTGETGIAGISVELLDSAGAVITTTTTDVNGDYFFGELLAGDYQVNVPTPPADAPISSTPTNTNDDNVDGDDNGTQSTVGGASISPMITLTTNGEPVGESAQGGTQDGTDDANGDMTVDFGFVPPLSLGSTLFYDNDNDGMHDSGEAGIAGITVELLNSSGVVTATTTTDPAGNYVFDNLLPGDYQVRVPTPPADAPLSSGPTSTSDDDVDGNDDGDQPGGLGTPATSPVITLAVGSEPASESGQGGSLGTATDADGNMTIDFGFTDYVSLGSTLFYDSNNDGQQGTGDTGIANIVVELLDSTGTVLKTTVTDVNGNYLFDELMPGDYQVRVPTAPADAPNSSTPTDMTDNQEDGDDNGLQLGGAGTATTSPVITLIVDDEPTTTETAQANTQDDALDDDNGDMTVDFGFVPPLSLGSTLFYDNDNDGQQGPGETGIAGVTVQLLRSSGAVVATTTTDANGDYVFDDLLPGDYQVRVPTPPSDAPMSSTTTSTTDDDVDSDDNGDQPGGFGASTTSPMITLAIGSEPTNESGQGGGLGSANDADGNMTVDFGFVPPLSLGSTLFYDNDNDGLQTAGEAGIAGITVELHDTAGNVIATTTTDANGDYLFDELLPGDYQVVVPTAPTDAPTSSTPTNMADDNVDGDDNGDQPGGAGAATTSPVITLAVDSEPTAEAEQGGTQDATDDDNGDMTIDFGFAPYVSLGSTVFHDNENNGLQDSSDTGIAGVTVELYDAAGNLVATTTTDSNGDYLFEELLPGDYQVVIPSAPADAPVSSQPTSLADDNMDEDDNGDQPGGSGAVTTSPTITLHADSEPMGEPGQGGTQDSADDDNGDMTVDFGFFKPVSVGDIVWYDNNDNGQQDTGEAGVAGVTVNLFDSAGNPVTDVNGNPVGPATTDANGNYLFEELPPGDYYVEFDLSTLPGPEWYVGKQNESGVADDEDSDADSNSGQSSTTPFLSSGEEDVTLDMGIVAPVKVGDRVWYDDNRDGLQDVGEAGVENVMAVLHDTVTGQPVLDQFGVPIIDLTDANGDYLFENLPPGDYYVTFQLSSLPSGYVVTQPDQGSDDTMDSDADPSTGVTAPTGFLPSNTEDLTLDMGIYRPEGVRVGDKVWLDNDRDGEQNAGEPGVPGVTATLVDNAGNPVTQDRDGNPITSQITNGSGNYLFDNLPPGDYAVVFDLSTLPVNHVVTSQDDGSDDLLDSDVDPTTGMTPSTGPLADDEQDLSLDLGIYPTGNVIVGDTVWYDDNHDGLQDNNEQGVAGVTVNLFDSAGNPVTDVAGNPVGPTTTDSNGKYLFEELPAGDYYVEFDLNSLPAGYVPTIQDATSSQSPATSDQADSDAGPTSGQTAPTGLLFDGEEDLTLDMGIVAPVSVGDIVWYDSDNDGMQDSGESGVAGVTVELFDAAGNPVTDMAGNPVSPTATDSNGNYLFEDLPPGDYYVQFDLSTLPSGYVPTAPNMGGNDGTDSDASPSTGATLSTGFLTSGSDDMSLDMGIVELAGVRVGDLVWYDDDRNGIQDPGETGVDGVTVELFDAAGNSVTDMAGNPVGPTTTDANGNYLFDNLPPGDYYVQFELGTLPADSIITVQDAGSDDSADSDADLATGESAKTGDLAAGEEDLTLDMGIYRPASIGDTVWEDSNADGVQDAGEPGIENVIVELFNADGTPATDMNGNSMTTTTDSNGNYQFDDLYPGDYYVAFTAPAGYNPSPQDATDDQSDSDADPITGQTAITMLSSGEHDPTWDAGFYPELPDGTPEPLPTPISTPAPLPDEVRVGDRVWYDNDGDGVQGDPADEPGVESVTVTLYKADGTLATDLAGNVVAPIMTDSDGNYLFDNLPEGDYYVQFDLSTLPGGYQVTEHNATNDQQPGASDQSDSDGDPNSGRTGTTGLLPGGSEDLTLDLGIVAPVRVGDRVWYDNDGDGIQDDLDDEPGVEGVTVILLNADGTPATDMAGNPVAPATTDTDGNYIFENLPPGDYQVMFDLGTLPDDHMVTEQNATDDQQPATSDQSDSDADSVTGLTDPTGPLMAGEEDLSLDLGILPIPPVEVGDTVWYDEDSNGIQDAGEDGVEGVTVTLFNADGSPVTDMDGNPVGPVVTDSNGNYLFDKLPAGDYYVQFDLTTLPDGYAVTEQDATSDQADSDGDPNTGVTGATGFLAAGSQDLTLDLGIAPVQSVTVGDRVWYDNDRDGIQGSVDDEPGVEDVTVMIFNADGSPVTDVAGNPVGTQSTNSDGEYLFTNLPPGDYYVQFDLETLPKHYVVTEANAANEQSPATSDQTDSDASTSTGETHSTGFLPGGSEDLTLDMGIVQLDPDVRVGDRVWLDKDRDGIQDAGESGVGGVVVSLYDTATDQLLGVAFTDSSGNYLFDKLFPGEYHVQFDLSTIPNDHAVTQQDATNDQSPETSGQLDSDVSPEDGISASTGILFTGEEDMSLDMGIYPLNDVTVGDTVWYDSDDDGLQDDDELGVQGVTVMLYDTATNQRVAGVPAQQTDSTGNYLFEGLPAGDYYVVFDLDTLPDGYGVTAPNATDDQSPATSDQSDSDANPVSGRTGSTGPLSGNESDLTLDMGIVQMPGVTVGDLVWYDDNGDGIQDPSEAGVAGVTVYLYDEITGEQMTNGAGDPLAQVTDGNGEYLFTDLPPGQYHVQFDLDTVPNGYLPSPVDQEASDTSDSDAGPDGITPPTDVLASGNEDRTLDMGIYKPVQVGDTVWFDDGNGQQDPDEAGVPDVGVTLHDAETGEVVGTTTTDENGNYLFDGLPPGNYRVEFDLTSLPEGYMVTSPDMEGDDNADSDADPETGRTPESGFLSSGEADLSLDMGIVKPVSIGDLVWIDEDMDGLQDADETGVADVTVTLYDAGGNPVTTATTDEKGNYLFEGLPPGAYSVGFDLTTLPEGYVVTQPNATNRQQPTASDQTDSDVNPDDGRTPNTDFLPSGTAHLALDMGVHKPVEDEVRVGGQVWEDTDLDGETDSTEKLWPGITVALYSQEDPSTPVAITVTGENGNYLFENLAPGEYFATLVPESLPEGALPPSYYSAGTPDDLRSIAEPLGQGEEALELDMALRFQASLSGLAWLDANGDGVRSVDEEVLSNVAVELYDATGEKVGEMATDEQGAYFFEALDPGNYRVTCPAVKGYNLSPNLQGEDSSRDSDIDPATNESGTKFVGSGQHLPNIDLGLYEQGSITNLIWVDINGNDVLDSDEAGIAGLTVFLFNEAGEVVGETVTDAEGRYGFSNLAANDYYIAFKPPADLMLVTEAMLTEEGFIRGPMISVAGGNNLSALDIGLTQPSALGNYVWLDTNKDGLVSEGETGVPDAMVNLLDADGNFLESTKTDSDGRFVFSVIPGDYQLEFVPIDGMEFTLQNQGDDGTDSDVDPESGRTLLISLGSNVSDFSHYAGLIVSPTAIQLMSLAATETPSGVTIEWNTGTELSTFGFKVYRSRDGIFENAIAVTDSLVLARGGDEVYTFTDTTVDAGQVYSYWLVEVQNDQQTYHYGPARVMVEGIQGTTLDRLIFLPLIQK